MMISFLPLKNSHFPLLLKWLETPHVKQWWDNDVNWMPDLIEKRYLNYTKGYKVLTLEDDVIKKPMYAFIIYVDEEPIGYIQYYNKHDFPPEQGYKTTDLPDSCAAIDWYIGELKYTGRGIGPKALNAFLDSHVFPKFQHAFVDPETNNKGAIRAYEKAGFATVKTAGDITWMLRAN